MTTAIAETLDQIRSEAAQLAPEDQDLLAGDLALLHKLYQHAAQAYKGQDIHAAVQRLLDDALADLQWERTLDSPEGQAIAQRLAEEALDEEARGEVEDGGFDGL